MSKKVIAVIVVLALVAIAGVLWWKGKLNKDLPAKWQHVPKSNFIGLNRRGIMVMQDGGKVGIPGIDLNISDWT